MADQVENVRQYIDALPPEVQDPVIDIRRAIIQEVPGAGEKMAYGIPTVTLGGKNADLLRGVEEAHRRVPDSRRRRRLPGAHRPLPGVKSTAQFPLGNPCRWDSSPRWPGTWPPSAHPPDGWTRTLG